MYGVTKKEFLLTEAGASAKVALHHMVQSPAYNTDPAYDISLERSVLFIDRHINYLVKHPYINPVSYISNLKIMTKASR